MIRLELLWALVTALAWHAQAATTAIPTTVPTTTSPSTMEPCVTSNETMVSVSSSPMAPNNTVTTTNGTANEYSVRNASQFENKGAVFVVITRSGTSFGAASVQLKVTAKTVNNPSAIKTFRMNVPFQPGARTATVKILIKDDCNFEPNEEFDMTISNPSDGVVAVGKATLQILDDDVKFDP